MKTLAVHPLNKRLPPVSEAYENCIIKQIGRDGLKTPIVLYQGMILSGRIRQLACDRHGIKPKYVDLPEDEDPVLFLIRDNLQHRHHSPGQRATVADELATAPHGGDRKSNQAINFGLDLTREQAAEMCFVSMGLIDMVRRIRRERPRLFELVRSGEMNPNEAVTLLDSDTVSGSALESASVEELQDLAADERAEQRRTQRQDKARNERDKPTEVETKDRQIISLIALALTPPSSADPSSPARRFCETFARMLKADRVDLHAALGLLKRTLGRGHDAVAYIEKHLEFDEGEIEAPKVKAKRSAN